MVVRGSFAIRSGVSAATFNLGRTVGGAGAGGAGAAAAGETTGATVGVTVAGFVMQAQVKSAMEMLRSRFMVPRILPSWPWRFRLPERGRSPADRAIVESSFLPESR